MAAENTYLEILESINQKYDALYEDMGKLAQLVIDIHGAVLKEPEKPRQFNGSFEEWKDETYRKADLLVASREFPCNREVFKAVYNKMTRVYGICWAQESVEYKENYGVDGYTKKMDIVWGKEMLRSLFDSILDGMTDGITVPAEEPVKVKESCKYGSCDDIIRPLIERYNDSSRYGCATFHRVYTRMGQNGDIDWKRAKTRYINKFGTSGMTKKTVIESSPTMMTRFKESVDELMREAGSAV